MKRALALLLSLVMALSLAACGGDAGKNPDQGSQSSNQESQSSGNQGGQTKGEEGSIHGVKKDLIIGVAKDIN